MDIEVTKRYETVSSQGFRTAHSNIADAVRSVRIKAAISEMSEIDSGRCGLVAEVIADYPSAISAAIEAATKAGINAKIELVQQGELS